MRCVVWFLRSSTVNLSRATGCGGRIKHYSSCNFQLALLIVNRQRVSRWIYGLLRLHLLRGNGVVCVIVVAQRREGAKSTVKEVVVTGDSTPLFFSSPRWNMERASGTSIVQLEI